MSDSSLPVQAAIVAALEADAGVAALVGARIYDRVPEATVFPYVSLGPETGDPFDAAAMSGWDATIQIDTWSRKGGRVEAKTIMAAISARLHRGALNVTGHALVFLLLEFQTVLDGGDGETVHGVQRFGFRTHTED